MSKTKLKKRVIHYLLIFCIGLMPSFGYSDAFTDHDILMSERCFSSMAMDSVDHNSCAGDICIFLSGHCGSGFSLTMLSTPVVNQIAVTARMIGYNRSDSRFRSHLAVSIYRPPIA